MTALEALCIGLFCGIALAIIVNVYSDTLYQRMLTTRPKHARAKRFSACGSGSQSSQRRNCHGVRTVSHDPQSHEIAAEP